VTVVCFRVDRAYALTNLLTNPGAESGNATGWTTILNGGDGMKFNWDNVIRTGSYSFQTSYGVASLKQTVDLLAAGYTAAQLDAAPDIAFGMYYATRFDQGGRFYTSYKLLAADGTTVIASSGSGTSSSLLSIAGNTSWTLNSHTFSGYGAGVRYAYFEFGGRDQSGWAGNYGTHFDDAFLTVDDGAPAVSGLSPADGATSVSTTANLVLTFDRTTRAGTGTLAIKTSTGDILVETITVSGALLSGNGSTTLTLNPSEDLSDVTSYYVTWTANAFKNSFGQSVPAQSSPTYWNFTTGDGTAPVISSVSATASVSGATVLWTTNEAASSRLQYGPTVSYGTQTSLTDTSPRVTSHGVILSGLLSCALYHYRILSADASGNTGTGSDAVFTTTGCTGSSSVTSQTGSTMSQTETGSLSLFSGTGITITVPAASTTNDVVYQIKQLDASTVIATAGSPGGKTRVGSMFNILALSGATANVSVFSKAITVILRYTAADIAGLIESSLWIHRYDGSSWTALDVCSVDTFAKTVTCTTTNFSDFSIFGTAAPVTEGTQSTSGGGGGGGGLRASTLHTLVTRAEQTLLARYHSILAVDGEASSSRELREIARTLPDSRSSSGASVEHVTRATTSGNTLTATAARRRKLLLMVGNELILYTDVETDAWYAPYVADLATQGIAQGYRDDAGKLTGKFGVVNPVTRAEVLKMTLAAAKKTSVGKPPRNLSAQGTWAAPYVGEAERIGLTVFPVNADVHAPATRGEVMQILLEVMGLPVGKKPSTFMDVPVNHPYSQAIAVMEFYELVEGDTDASGKPLHTFRPNASINRAEVAKLIALLRETLE